MQNHDDKALRQKEERQKALAVERRRILALPPERALEAILDHPLPVTLVQSMAEEDLHLLVQAIGPDDALPLLSLASNDQWEYLLDMETWQRDQPGLHHLTEWLDRLLKADADRFTHWIAREQRDTLEYYLSRTIELYIREYEEDPNDIGDGFFSDDNVHYVRPRPYPDMGEETQTRQELRDQFINDILKRLSVYDYTLYQEILLQSTCLVPAEAEEEMLRQRNVRLAEKGFIPFDEAVGVYQPLTIEELLQRKRKPDQTGGRPVESYPWRVDTAAVTDHADYFTRTLLRIRDDSVLQRLQAEFAGLCNQVIIADQKQVAEKAALSQVVVKVSGYISIGLEQADAQAGTDDPYRSANLIQHYLLGDLFRVGYGCALNLKWQADRWRRQAWFTRIGLAPAFWGEAWLGVLGGLLIKKPLYFDNYASGVLYREFACLAEIRRSGQVLEQIMAWDDLLALMKIDLPPMPTRTFLTCENLVLTLWANHTLGMQTVPLTPLPLTLEHFKKFFATLWQHGAAPHRIKKQNREAFMNWLAVCSGLDPEYISRRMGSALEELFIRMEEELGALSIEKIDPRYIQLFLFQAEL